MCIMSAYAIASVFEIMRLDEVSEESYGLLLLFPVLGSVAAPVVGLVMYGRKKTLGWVLCCGYTLFMFAQTVVGYFVFRRLGVELDDGGELHVRWVAEGVLYLLAVMLFMSRKIRSVFFDFEKTALPDMIVSAVVAALFIGVCVFIPVLVSLSKPVYVIIGCGILFYALRWFAAYNNK